MAKTPTAGRAPATTARTSATTRPSANAPSANATRAAEAQAATTRTAPQVRAELEANTERPEFSKTASRTPTTDVTSGNGKRGPKSALEGGDTGTASGDRFNDGKGQEYSVQVHSDEDVGGLKKGLQVLYVKADSGDEAGLKVRQAHKANFGLSIRGVTPATDPDANSMGGERDAAIMLANAEAGGEFAPVQTAANAKAVEGLGKADIEDLGE